ncbi:MAG: phosphotriesterase-related protein [Rhodobacteraceae bacterium]|nr:phosphotriesterase-related protein [Paracoccaceae bacterium]
MAKIRTLLGDIEKSELGFTYVHEHLITFPPLHQKDRDLELSDYDASLSELKTFKSVGGVTLVEASTLDYGRDSAQMVSMSKAASVNVVAVTGFNKSLYFPKWVEEKSLTEITDMLIRDVMEGMDGSEHKAGHIKSGSSYNFIHPLEEKVTRAAALAQKVTGAPLWLHTEAGTMGMEMLDILEDEGIDLGLVVVGHSDRNADPYYHRSMATRGAYVQFDGPGKVKYYPDSVRVECVKKLLDGGFSKQLLISGDMGRASYLAGYGGGPGFAYIKTKFIPRMIAEGVSEENIHRIFVENPADWLAKF